MSVGNGGKVAPPRDWGGTEWVEMFVNDCKGSGHGPAGEANASDCLVMFNKMGKGPHGGHNVLADALDEPVVHGKEKGGVTTPPMVGPTWPRVRSILGSDCLPALSQGTALLCLDCGLISHCLHCYRAHPMSRDWGCISTSLSYLSMRP